MDGQESWMDDDHANAHTAQENVAVASGLCSVPYITGISDSPNTFDEQFRAQPEQTTKTMA